LESGFTLGNSHPGTGTDALALEQLAAKRRLLMRISAAGGAIFVLGILIIWWSMPRPDGIALRMGSPALMPPLSVMPKPPPPAPPPLPTEVALDIISEPEGATVLIGDEEKGKTPLVVNVSRGKKALEITLKAEGYKDSTERVTPDINQRIRVTMAKKKKLFVPGGKPQTGGGFHRFD